MCLPCTWCAIAPLSCNFVSVCTHVNYKCAPLLAMALSALMCADCKPVAIIPMKKNQKQNKQTLVWTNMMYLLYLQNSFFPPHHCLTPPSGGTPCDINIIYTSLKSTFSGLQYVADNGPIFIRLAVIAFQNREITRNSDKIWPYSSSRSSIDLGVNRKLICEFLLVINSNPGHICYRFWDIDA